MLNGVDYDTWNPEIDPWIPQRYGSDSIDQKYVNKRVLRERFMLRDQYKPIVACVGGLVAWELCVDEEQVARAWRRQSAAS